jgi:predicted nucleic acid-binding protein
MNVFGNESEPGRTLYLAEPPARYLIRPSVVIDCSVLAGLLFQEHWFEEANQKIQGRSLKAPWLLDVEITSVALKKHRSGYPDLARSGLENYALMEIDRFDTSPQSVCALALRYQLSAYDAAYLWLAADLQCPLATFDAKLAAAAQLHLGSLP